MSDIKLFSLRGEADSSEESLHNRIKRNLEHAKPLLHQSYEVS